MATRISGRTSTWRLRLGNTVLSAASATDTSLVKTRLAQFERVHRSYADAQRKVGSAESQLRAAVGRLEHCDALQDKAVDALFRALIADGQPADQPFAPFGGPTLKGLVRLPFAEEAEAIHQLVAAVLRDEHLGKATIQAAQAAEKAARAVEQALVAVQTMEQRVREARQKRETRGQAWDNGLGSLKLDARAVARAGMPHVYAALFPSRPITKNKAATANPPPVPDTPPAPTTPVTESSNAA